MSKKKCLSVTISGSLALIILITACFSWLSFQPENILIINRTGQRFFLTYSVNRDGRWLRAQNFLIPHHSYLAQFQNISLFQTGNYEIYIGKLSENTKCIIDFSKPNLNEHSKFEPVKGQCDTKTTSDDLAEIIIK